MKLHSIQIKNYRSIEDFSFDVNPLEDGTFTYGFIGVNEAGKSSILKALALKEVKEDGEGLIPVTPKDFREKTKPIEIVYQYVPEPSDVSEYQSSLSEVEPVIDSAIGSLDFINEIFLSVSVSFDNPMLRNISLEIPKLEGEDKVVIQERLKPIAINKMHKSIFWTAEDRYLISRPINLSEFASSPDNVSIPLKNCFSLAGITNIQERINMVGDDSTEIEQLQEELGNKVTEHIKTVWPTHPIEITFVISSGLINFHVHDQNTKGRAKTAEQRSDGFKQFISFLLTISAQDRNNELSNAILLLDEPETHLHPEAQEYLLGDLVKITQNGRNNVVFFATHSIFMIDKVDLSRNYRIKKEEDKTEKIQFGKGTSTYSSVTYEVFGIPSTDYHTELYSKLHQQYQDVDPLEDKRETLKNFDDNFLVKEKGQKKNKPWRGTPNQVTLHTYIRNCIHHSDNGDKYTRSDLKESIVFLRDL